ncbi:MAG: tetratricopeptide repeat protein [Thiohalomonadales bacterium]
MDTLHEITTIKWLLVATLVGVFLLVALAFFLAAFLWLGSSAIRDQQQANTFKLLAENYLAKNEIDDLAEHSEKRLETHPHDVWAHWYSGQTKYHQGIYPDSKRNFERALELEPSWDSAVESWLDKLEEKIKEGPKLVE